MDVLVLFLGNVVMVYTYALIIYIFMSWFPGARESRFGELLGYVTEPYLEIFRKIIPPIGMIDFSPIIAIFGLRLAYSGLLAIFSMFGLI